MTPSCSASLDESHDVLTFVIWSFPRRGLHDLVSKNAPLWTRPSRRTRRIGEPLASNRLRVKWLVDSTLRALQFVVCIENSWFPWSNADCPIFEILLSSPSKFLESSQISSNTHHRTLTTRCRLVLRVWSRFKIRRISPFLGESIDAWHGAGGAVFDERLPFYKQETSNHVSLSLFVLTRPVWDASSTKTTMELYYNDGLMASINNVSNLLYFFMHLGMQ